MSETAPVDPAEPCPAFMAKPNIKKRGRKQVVGLAGVNRKTPSPSVSKVITEALSLSQERAGMSLAALKKVLAAAGYDVDKNNSRIKLVLKSLVSKGTLVQTKGTGASGSFRLSKKAPELVKVKKAASAKSKKLVLSRESKSPKGSSANKRAPKPRASASPKAARGVRKAAGPKGRPPRKSPAKADRPTAGRPKGSQQKAKPRKAASKK
ncbi:histone H1t [Pipistrellus kuhlii]|uniref:histone H1t n=1 Tax=Pipistrellus kuhlii TaxID=59472 RepID=UPI00174EF74C|nr:histone H1t [Pipistrellus kuhlii]